MATLLQNCTEILYTLPSPYLIHVDHNMHLVEGNTPTRIKRAKATNWPRVMSKFLLDWYLDKKRGMPPKTKFKKMHHVWCTSAVNAKFRTAYSVDQVHRHFRRFKEIWIVVTRYANEIGSRFNNKRKILILPAATMASLPVSIIIRKDRLFCIIFPLH